MTEVAFVFVDSTKDYYAYVFGVRVGYLRRSYVEWAFRADSSAANIFSPRQLAEIHQACRDKASVLNITERLSS